MLTIAFVFASLLTASLGSPTALGQDGVNIPLLRRSTPPIAVNITDLQGRITSLVTKYHDGFAASNLNTGSSRSLGRSIHRRAAAKPSPSPEELKAEDSGIWQGLITVGNPTQTFAVSFDTGSADLVIPGPDCTTCRGRSRYDPQASGSSTVAGDFDFNAGDGRVSGELSRDEVGLAGLSVRNQTLGAAWTYTPGFASSIAPADGVLGMAFGGASMFETSPLIQALFEQKQVTAPVFAFKLSEDGPELSLGGVNDQLYSGSFTNVKVKAKPFWNVALDGVSVNGAVVLHSTQAMIDTGTPLILAPFTQARELYAAISGSTSTRGPGGSEVWTFPCNSGTTLSLIFGARAFEVPANLFNRGMVEKGQPGQCVGAVVGSDQVSFWVVGTTFLQTVYTSFDMAKEVVGFAALKQ